MDVHPNDVRDRQREQFFEVPPTLCKRFAKHPGRKCQEYLLPRGLLFFDLPVWKRRLEKPLVREINQNLGFHVNGCIFVLPKSHLNDDFGSHIARKQHLYVDRTINGRSLYDKGGIERVHVEPVTFDPYNIADYSLKTVKFRKVDYDTTIILPRSWTEVHLTRSRLDPEAQAIKHIQAATNVSDEFAMQIYNGVSQKKVL